ncbi:hypothetical protein CL618_01225, partial [archaeon]|nr:hypothetical protein [archaeon]
PLSPTGCVDSDGQDYYKKGSTTGIRYESKITEKNPVITTLTDSCYKYVGHYKDVLSCDSPDCYVTEFYCEIRSGQSMMNEKTPVCPYGCRDGACLREPLDTINPPNNPGAIVDHAIPIV